MRVKAKRVKCDACIIQVVRVGWESLRLPISTADCEAIIKVVWGRHVPENLKPCHVFIGDRPLFREGEAAPKRAKRGDDLPFDPL
jgi:hypothetical protein